MRRLFSLRASSFGLIAILAPGLAGCPSAAVYRTARTLNRGEVDLSLMVSATHVEIPEVTVTDPNTGSTTVQTGLSVTYPNLAPEFSAHYGITDDIEFGGRIGLSALMIESDLKLRLIGNRLSSTHVAVDPAVGYQTLLFLEGVHATLPLVFTQDLREDLAINLAGYAGYRDLHATTKSEADGGTNDFDRFAVKSTSVGGSVGFEIRGPKIHVMPILDVSRTVSIAGVDGSSASLSGAQTYVTFGVVVGAVVNRAERPANPPAAEPAP